MCVADRVAWNCFVQILQTADEGNVRSDPNDSASKGRCLHITFYAVDYYFTVKF